MFLMKKHYRHIDVLKGIFILVVIFEHAKWPLSFWQKTYMLFWDRMAIPCFMTISGFLYTRSIEKGSIREYYSLNNIIHKLKRYLLPYSFFFLLEAFLWYLVSLPSLRNVIFEIFHYEISFDPAVKFTFKQLLHLYLIGGEGPGNYYTPVLIQLIFVFPLLYLFIKKYGYKGLLASAVFCLSAELWQYLYHIPRTLYRLLILRHIMTICFGIYIATGHYKKNLLLNLLSLGIGISYIIAHSYHRWTPVFFNNGWADVNFVACLYFCPIIGFLLSKEKMHFKPLEQIGKASYHIYLTQMIYYNFVKRDIAIQYFKNPYLWCLFSMIVCTFIGLSFYQTEMKIRQKHLSKS